MRPPSADPSVKPQNISVTSDARRAFGQYSAAIVIVVGIAPPSPTPVRNRSTINDRKPVLNAEQLSPGEMSFLRRALPSFRAGRFCIIPATMDFDQLVTFLEVAKLGSFSRAGQKVFRSQSAVSAQIRQLEQAYGDRLLDRSGKDVTLTPAGRALFAYAERML